MRGLLAGHGRAARLIGAGLAASTLAALTALLCAPRPAVLPSPSRLEEANAALRRKLELASGQDFYLVLDPSRSALTLMLRGAALSDYPVHRVDVGVPRALLVPRDPPAAWQTRIWSDGRLVPGRERDRLELHVVADGAVAPEDPPVPPLPEEIYPVPARYRIVYEGGLTLEIRSLPEDASYLWRLAHALRARTGDALAALWPGPQLRLRLELPPEAAASLYRALPPDTRFVLAPS